jgi:hypothetical protein
MMRRLNICQHESQQARRPKQIRTPPNSCFPCWESGMKDIKCKTTEVTFSFDRLLSAYKGASIVYDPPSNNYTETRHLKSNTTRSSVQHMSIFVHEGPSEIWQQRGKRSHLLQCEPMQSREKQTVLLCGAHGKSRHAGNEIIIYRGQNDDKIPYAPRLQHSRASPYYCRR